MQTTQTHSIGGDFIVKETDFNEVFIPEEFNEEQKMMADACNEFLDSEVMNKFDAIDKQEPGLIVSLLNKAGELGLLGTAIPDGYGGLGKDFTTNLLLSEKQGKGHSFAVAISAHTCIGSLPTLFFGTEAQKQKYLPKLATGEWKAAYCLTEPGSGSDALAAKTKAVRSADGKSWILNGQKMWITNAGFADVFIVFAQVDGDKFTGFIIERNSSGFTVGEEEHKMGIKGSSTRQVFLTDCKIPKENLLGEIGKGHKIAFNILNMGRIKLSAAALGAAKNTSSGSVKYALDRMQFGKRIAEFGAIQHKLAEQAIRIFAVESALYRTGKNIESATESFKSQGLEYAPAHMAGVEEFAIEASILKVNGSETLDFCVDEGVQIYGGYGYSADYMMDRCYRDSRINRIFEGTNEINRMLIVDMLMKRAMKGKLNLMGPAMALQKELMGIPDMSGTDGEPFSNESKALTGFKKSILLIAGYSAQKLMQKLESEQEVLMHIADMIIETYLTESVFLRARKLAVLNHAHAEVAQLIMKILFFETAEKINYHGKCTALSVASGDEQRMLLMGLKRFTKTEPVNGVALRRKIAGTLIEKGNYWL